MTWTWERAGPREWRVSIDTRPQWRRDAERMYQLAQRNVTPEEMAAFYARHHLYRDQRAMTEAELLAQHILMMREIQRRDAP